MKHESLQTARDGFCAAVLFVLVFAWQAQAADPKPADQPSSSTKQADKDVKPATAETPAEVRRETREEAAENRRDRRTDNSDAREGRREQRQENRADRLRSADVGLWFSRNLQRGLTIADVASQGSISKSGLREGDVVISVNGQKVAEEGDFMAALMSEKVRDGRVRVAITRNGKEQTIELEPGRFLEEMRNPADDSLEGLGIMLDDRASDRLLVWRVYPRSPAFYAGLRSNDMIVAIDEHKVATIDQLIKKLESIKAGTLEVTVTRADRERNLEVDLSEDYRGQRITTFRQNLEDRRERASQNRDERSDLRQEVREEVRDAREERRE